MKKSSRMSKFELYTRLKAAIGIVPSKGLPGYSLLFVTAFGIVTGDIKEIPTLDTIKQNTTENYNYIDVALATKLPLSELGEESILFLDKNNVELVYLKNARIITSNGVEPLALPELVLSLDDVIGMSLGNLKLEQ